MMIDRIQQRCSRCFFWEEYDDGLGLCRRYPPVMNVLADAEKHGEGDLWSWVYPVVREDDSCGEFQLESVEEDAANRLIQTDTGHAEQKSDEARES